VRDAGRRSVPLGPTLNVNPWHKPCVKLVGPTQRSVGPGRSPTPKVEGKVAKGRKRWKGTRRRRNWRIQVEIPTSSGVSGPVPTAPTDKLWSHTSYLIHWGVGPQSSSTAYFYVRPSRPHRDLTPIVEWRDGWVQLM